MSLGKLDIAKNISTKAHLSKKESLKIVDEALSILKLQSKNNIVKITGFGSFLFQKSPGRIGRNPKTNISYKIPSRRKLKFFASNKIKKILN